VRSGKARYDARFARNAARVTSTPLVEEPLLEGAPLARETASRLCRADPVTGESCAPVHGIWLYLRVLGLTAGPEHHAEFFRDALGVVARGNRHPRVLVSGAADFSMTAHVLWACRHHGALPAVTVVDLCETPLFLNRWYGERAGLTVATCASDIMRYAAAAPYDAICTHSFLGRFAVPDRRALIANWARLLKPGGVAITVNRVRPVPGTGRIGFSTEQSGAFRATVVRRAREMRTELDVDPDDLGARAEAYAAQRWLYPIRSHEEIRQLFEGEGLQMETLIRAELPGTKDGAAGGPATLEGASYACIVARKPG